MTCSHCCPGDVTANVETAGLWSPRIGIPLHPLLAAQYSVGLVVMNFVNLFYGKCKNKIHMEKRNTVMNKSSGRMGMAKFVCFRL